MIQGALPKLSAIILSTLVCVACNSESESEPEPLVGAAIPEMDELTEAAAADVCTPEFPGVEVDVSLLDSSNGLLSQFGGPCKISNTVIASAADVHRSFLNDNYCSVAEETASAIGQGDVAIALENLDDLIAQGQYTETESEELRPALLLCGDESVKDAAVEDFLKSAELTVYSIGTAEYQESNCPAIVWSLSSDQQGQVYNISGLEQCAGMGLPHAQLFNPENNPDGQLPGDYIKEVLGYNGSLPDHFDYKNTSYSFVSADTLHSAVNRPKADRTILGENAKQYIYWSSGEYANNEYLSADEALTLQFHSEELRKIPLRQRALTSLQRSYGAPALGEVRLVEDGDQPGVHATITTSSGDQFVMIAEPANDMTGFELSDWLSDSHVELLVAKGGDSELDDNLILDGALFSDGIKSVHAQLEACECSTQGILGSLGEDELASNKELEQLRKEFIARARRKVRNKDWNVSGEPSPRAIAYSVSRYNNSLRDNDAALVVHNGGEGYTLYVASDSACNDESLLFEFPRENLFMPADCRVIDTRGVAYTLPDSSSELIGAMRRGSRLKIGLVEPASDSIREEYQFSLMGFAKSMDVLEEDEMGFSGQVVGHFTDITPSEQGLFEQLEKPPVFCSSGASSPDCVPEKMVPKVAAAKPAVRAAKRGTPAPEPENFVLGYAKVVAAQLGSGNSPECIAIVDQVMKVASSNGSSDMLAREIDLIVGRAPNICF